MAADTQFFFMMKKMADHPKFFDVALLRKFFGSPIWEYYSLSPPRLRYPAVKWPLSPPREFFSFFTGETHHGPPLRSFF